MRWPQRLLPTVAAWRPWLCGESPVTQDLRGVGRLASEIAAANHGQFGWLDVGVWGQATCRALARDTLVRAVSVTGEEDLDRTSQNQLRRTPASLALHVTPATLQKLVNRRLDRLDSLAW